MLNYWMFKGKNFRYTCFKEKLLIVVLPSAQHRQGEPNKRLEGRRRGTSEKWYNQGERQSRNGKQN